jgi:hypothetical protein
MVELYRICAFGCAHVLKKKNTIYRLIVHRTAFPRKRFNIKERSLLYMCIKIDMCCCTAQKSGDDIALLCERESRPQRYLAALSPRTAQQQQPVSLDCINNTGLYISHAVKDMLLLLLLCTVYIC